MGEGGPPRTRRGGATKLVAILRSPPFLPLSLNPSPTLGGGKNKNLMPQTFTVESTETGQRLDKFLLGKLGAASRTQVQKLIKSGAVQVNGKGCSVHHFLKPGDVVVVNDRGSTGSNRPLTRSATATVPAPSHDGIPRGLSTEALAEVGRGVEGEGEPTPTPSSVLRTPAILHEDADLLVIDKPSGLLVHPTDRGETNSLVNWLLAHHPAIASVGDDPRRPGIVHRLDRDVSGLMVVAKTPAAFSHLKQQFQDRRVGKEYTALVYGHFTQPEGVIRLPIGRSREGKFVAHPTVEGVAYAHDDREAIPRYRVVRAAGPHSLLDITIDTGRTHQIRAHLSAIGHPIVGDPIYRPRKPFLRFLSRRVKVDHTIGRPFLHAQSLRFTATDGAPLTFTSPLPPKLQAYLDAHP